MANQLTNPKDYDALEACAAKLSGSSLASLFDSDPERAKKFSISAGDLHYHYSRQLIDENALEKLLNLAAEKDLVGWRERLFNGENINTTEHRPALHMALRNSYDVPMGPNGDDVMGDVRAMRNKMGDFVHNLRAQQTFTDIVHIGIGGSHLGPQMAIKALAPYADGDLSFHFLSTTEPRLMSEVLGKLNPQKTLFIIATKSFGTRETLANAQIAKDWLAEQIDTDQVGDHFVALTANTPAALDFGIEEKHIFPFWEWVGGRFSLCSSIGLPVALAIGMDRFEEILQGAHAMDVHFKHEPLAQNMPVLMALMGIWNINFLGIKPLAILPYDDGLTDLPAYLQQLEMESNGKSVNRQGKVIDYSTSALIFGSRGTDGEHAFYQWLHQGPDRAACDFLAPLAPPEEFDELHHIRLAHFLAQPQALAFGHKAEKNEPYREFSGNRPSSLLMYQRLTPFILGQLVALYEHKTFVQGIIWNINSFDQWGVELGKKIAGGILPALQDTNAPRPQGPGLDEVFDLIRSAAHQGRIQNKRSAL